MNFSIQGSRPIWQQLTEQLARRIITGAYPLGSRFPAVRELAAFGGDIAPFVPECNVELIKNYLTHRV